MHPIEAEIIPASRCKQNRLFLTCCPILSWKGLQFQKEYSWKHVHRQPGIRRAEPHSVMFTRRCWHPPSSSCLWRSLTCVGQSWTWQVTWQVGHVSIFLRMVDTDMIMIVTSYFDCNGVSELFIVFGVCTNLKYVPIHEIVWSHGPTKSQALLFFHVFTACGAVSSFYGRNERKLVATW